MVAYVCKAEYIEYIVAYMSSFFLVTFSLKNKSEINFKMQMTSNIGVACWEWKMELE